jgi:hypothetical protein
MGAAIALGAHPSASPRGPNAKSAEKSAMRMPRIAKSWRRKLLRHALQQQVTKALH